MNEQPILDAPNPPQSPHLQARGQQGIDFHLAYRTLIKAYTRIRLSQAMKEKSAKERNNGKEIL